MACVVAAAAVAVSMGPAAGTGAGGDAPPAREARARDQGETRQELTTRDGPARGQAVADVYRRDCAVCHGPDGAGTDRGPDLAGAGRALVDFVVRTGRMPIDQPDDEIERRAPRYGAETIDELVAYVVGLQDGAVGDGPPIPDVDPAAGDVAEGGAVWRLNCASCHQWSGNGGAMLERAAPDVRHATPLEMGEAVRTGPFAMPAFGTSAVDDPDLDNLAAFLEVELKAPEDPGGWALGHIGPVAEGAVALGGLGALAVACRLLGTGRDRPRGQGP